MTNPLENPFANYPRIVRARVEVQELQGDRTIVLSLSDQCQKILYNIF